MRVYALRVRINLYNKTCAVIPAFLRRAQGIGAEDMKLFPLLIFSGSSERRVLDYATV